MGHFNDAYAPWPPVYKDFHIKFGPGVVVVDRFNCRLTNSVWWNLRIKDTLGQPFLSSVRRLSSEIQNVLEL